ncbi:MULTISPECIES: hypothetical protein [Enterobacterales]|uniref:hypothetical protein n=1 Tax=Enterobacterales TaxID=91347 RepID=UPI002ED852E1
MSGAMRLWSSFPTHLFSASGKNEEGHNEKKCSRSGENTKRSSQKTMLLERRVFTEYCTLEQRFNYQLQCLPSTKTRFYYGKINRKYINRYRSGYFHVNQRCMFVVKRATLDNFIRTFFSAADSQEKNNPLINA